MSIWKILGIVYFDFRRNDVLFYLYSLHFTDNIATINNAKKMETSFIELMGNTSVNRVCYFGRVGQSDRPSIRSIRKELKDLEHISSKSG
jgi:hypothetical protein